MIDQATHEHQVFASVSTLAVASIAHPKENSLSSPNVITQADMVYTRSEQIPSVSYLSKYVLTVTDAGLSNLHLLSLPGTPLSLLAILYQLVFVVVFMILVLIQWTE